MTPDDRARLLRHYALERILEDEALLKDLFPGVDEKVIEGFKALDRMLDVVSLHLAAEHFRRAATA